MILLAALDVTDLDDGYRFEFRAGHPSELAEYVGENDDVPLASGMDFGKWRAQQRTVRLYGVVIGSGTTVAAQQASFRTRMDALIAVMDPTALITITTTNEFGADSATLANVQPQRLVTEFEFADLVWHGSLELVCIDSPPEWSVVEGS